MERPVYGWVLRAWMVVMPVASFVVRLDSTVSAGPDCHEVSREAVRSGTARMSSARRR